MTWNIIETCADSATTQFGVISGSLLQSMTVAKIHHYDPEPHSADLKMQNCFCELFVAISVNETVNFMTCDLETHISSFDLGADILSMDCLEDGSLTVCSTSDGRLHCIRPEKEPYSEFTGEIFEDRVSRAAVQVKLCASQDASLSDIWILFSDGHLFCKRHIDANTINNIDSTGLSDLLTSLQHPWVNSDLSDLTLTLTPVTGAEAACLTVPGALVTFCWASDDPCDVDVSADVVELDSDVRRACYLPEMHQLVCLNAEGNLLLFDLSVSMLLGRWKHWKIEDFLALPSLNRDDRSVLAILRQEGYERVLEICALPDLEERTFTIKVNAGPVSILPLSSDVGPLAFLSCWDAFETSHAGLALKVLTEVDPGLKMMRLLARHSFEEAEELAQSFRLDRQIILVHKMAHLMSLPFDQMMVENMFSCLADIEALFNHPDLIRACLSKVFPDMKVQERFLKFLVTKLKDSAEASDKRSDLEKTLSLLSRLHTFQALKPSLDFTVDTWAIFSRADFYEKFFEGLLTNEVDNAFLFWERHESEILQGFLNFGDQAVEDLMTILEHYGLESTLINWLLTDFLPLAVSRLPSSCLTVIANFFISTVSALEHRRAEAWPELGIATLERALEAVRLERLFPGLTPCEQRAWLLSQLGSNHDSPFKPLQALLLRLKRLQRLRDRYNFRLRLADLESEEGVKIACRMLQMELGWDNLDVAMDHRIRAFLRDEGIEESTFLCGYVTELIARLEKELEPSASNELCSRACSVISFLSNALRLRCLLSLAHAVSTPWPQNVTSCVRRALEEERARAREGGQAVAHPLRAELERLLRRSEVHALLAHYEVPLHDPKLSIMAARNALRRIACQQLLAHGTIKPEVLKDMDQISSEAGLQPAAVRLLCLHQFLSRHLTHAALTFIETASGTGLELLWSAFRTAKDALSAATGAAVLAGDPLAVQEQIEMALSFGARLERRLRVEGELEDAATVTRDLAALRALRRLRRRFGKEAWLDEICDRAEPLLRELMLPELKRLEGSPSPSLELPSALRLLAEDLRASQDPSAGVELDAASLWLHAGLDSGPWAIPCVLRAALARLASARSSEPLSWVRPLALRLLERSGLVEDPRLQRQLLSQLAELVGSAESRKPDRRFLLSAHGPLRLCLTLHSALMDRVSKKKNFTSGLELSLCCRFSVEHEERVADTFSVAQLRQLLALSLLWARAIVMGAPADHEVLVELAQGLMECGLTLSAAWPFLHQLGAAFALHPDFGDELERLWDQMRQQRLPAALLTILTSRHLDPLLALGVAGALPFEASHKVIFQVVRKAPKSHKIARMVSLLATTYGRTCGHAESLALGANFRRVAKWVGQCRQLCPDLGSILLTGGHQRALQALLKAATATGVAATFSANTIVEFCADFKLPHRSYLLDFFEKLLSWPPELVEENAPAVKARIASAASALNLLLDGAGPDQRAEVSELLQRLLDDSDPFDLERLAFLLQHGAIPAECARSSKHCQDLVTFLLGWRRVGAQSRAEQEWLARRTHQEPLVFSEALILSPLAKTRLPFFAMLESPQTIIEAEVNPSIVGELVHHCALFSMTPDMMYLMAAKNLISAHTSWTRPTNLQLSAERLAWSGPYAEVDEAVWAQLTGLLRLIDHPKVAFAGAQAMVSATLSGRERCKALDLCVHFSERWLGQVASESERQVAQRLLEKFSAKRRELALQGELHKHRLASEAALALLSKPADLLQHLLEMPDLGPDAPDSGRFQAVAAIADLCGLNAFPTAWGLLKKWLRCSEGEEGLSGDDMTFNYETWNAAVQGQATAGERWVAPGGDLDLRRAAALLEQDWVRDAALAIVEELAFGLDETSLCQVRALFCALQAWPLATVMTAAQGSLPLQMRFHQGSEEGPSLEDYVMALGYFCRVESLWPCSLEDFLFANKAELVRSWLQDRRFASDPHGAALAVQLLMDFGLADPELWSHGLRALSQTKAAPATQGLLGRAVRFARRSLPASALLRLRDFLGQDMFAILAAASGKEEADIVER